MGWADIRDSFVKPAIGAVGGFMLGGPAGAIAGAAAVSSLESARQDGKAAKTQAQIAAEEREAAKTQQERAMDLQENRFAAEQKQLASERERYDSIYAPIEQGIADELAQGPNVQEAAGIAGGNFANEFDASIAARTRDEQRAGVNYRAGSSAQRMQGENDAYNRARGVATAQTDARREEDDQHFLKSNAFYQNGSGIQSQLLQGMQTMYGADYNAAIDQSNFAQGRANEAQQFSGALNQQKNNTIGSVVDIGTRLFTGGALGGGSGGSNPLTSEVSDSFVYGQGNSQPTAAIPQSMFSDGANYETPKANQYMNDGSTNQTQAAIAGSRRAQINQYG